MGDMSDSYLVLTAVGQDRPGLVHEISGVIHRAGANLEDSRMAILGGEFALIVLVAGDPASVEAVATGVTALESKLGLTITTKQTSRTAPEGDYLPYRIRVSGVDRPGIVSTVTTVLVGRGINVSSLESRVQYAPLSGTPMFVLQAELQIPAKTALPDLRGDIAQACDDENLDFQLEGG